MHSSERPHAGSSRRQRSTRGSNAMRIVRWCSSHLERSFRPETTCSPPSPTPCDDSTFVWRWPPVPPTRAAWAGCRRSGSSVPICPRSESLQRANVLVTHAGNNSVTEALAHGVPMLMLPFSTDQFDGAAAIEAAGLGSAADPYRVTPLELAEAIRLMIGTSHPALDRMAIELWLRPGAGIARAAVGEWLDGVPAVGTRAMETRPDRMHDSPPPRR